jgi:hypothetical protein
MSGNPRRGRGGGRVGVEIDRPVIFHFGDYTASVGAIIETGPVNELSWHDFVLWYRIMPNRIMPNRIMPNRIMHNPVRSNNIVDGKLDNTRNPQKLGVSFVLKYAIVFGSGRCFLFYFSFLFSLLLFVGSPVAAPNRGILFTPQTHFMLGHRESSVDLLATRKL